MATFGPNYSGNQAKIDNNIVAGATILATVLRDIFTNLNASGASVGSVIGDTANFTAPFNVNGTLVENIITGYNAAISGITTQIDVGVAWIL